MLKPCPFCGDSAFVNSYMRGNDFTWEIHCNGCAVGMIDDNSDCSKERVIEWWNTRVIRNDCE